MEKDELNNENVNPVEEYVKKIQEEQDILHGKISGNSKPDFLLPQFKNIEEQAKSYKELQSLQTKQAQELAKYKNNENFNFQKQLAQQQLALLDQKAQQEKQKLNDFYAAEISNLANMLNAGKISKQEAQKCMAGLDEYMMKSLQNTTNQYKNAYTQCGQVLNMVSPQEFFKDDLQIKNYLAPISEFLENNYKKMPISELENVKNLIVNLENSLRNEIQNEVRLSDDNNSYRQSLASATNLNPNNASEKIYTYAEIKNMKPEEFRKNQKAILEQFVAHKIQ